MWNFILTGQVRAGTSVVLSSINKRRHVTCHSDLFNPQEAIRKEKHEAYFGTKAVPEWFEPGLTNPWQYLNNIVFSRAQKEESVLGVHLPYSAIQELELYDFMANKNREGSFGVVHVTRSPVACFISLKQAQKTGIWCEQAGTADYGMPLPVRLDVEELLDFCNVHEITRAKIVESCDDCLEVKYTDLLFNYQRTMCTVFDFIELEPEASLANSSYYRLWNRPVQDRVTNWAEIRLDIPTALRQHIDSDDFF